MSLLINKETQRIPFDVDWRKKSSVRSKEEALFDMVSLTVKNLAAKNKTTAESFLNTHTIQEIASAINMYAKNEQDVISTVHLVVDHAQTLITKYNQDGNNLRFEDLVTLKNKFPEKPTAALIAYELAKRRSPKIADAAQQLLLEESSAPTTDPYVRCSPVKSQISYITVKDLETKTVSKKTDAGFQWNSTDNQLRYSMLIRT